MSIIFRRMQVVRALFLFAVLAASAGMVSAADSSPDWIFYNGAVVTMEDSQSTAQAIAILGDKILAVGSDADILARRDVNTRVVDLQGRALLPGFVDAHTHVLNDAQPQGMSLDEAQYLALRNGITSLGDLYVDPAFLREIQEFDQAGNLRVRTGLYLVWNTNCGKVLGDWYKKVPITRAPGEMLRVNGVKIFTDGGSCGKVALSFELVKGDGTGDLWLTQEQLNGAVKEAQDAGYQVAIHAIGDRALAQAQNAIAFALDGRPNTLRHRIEHVSVIPPELLARFGEIGAIPVLPGEYPSCHPFGPDIPEGYRAWEWPWAELRAANPNLPVAWHSDYPFASINPLVHLYGFVTRKDVAGSYPCTPHLWLRDDTLSVEDALSIMTMGSAYALFRDEEVGSLKPGKYADLILLNENPLIVDAERLKDIKVLLTMVGGRVEFCEQGAESLCPGYVARILAPRPNRLAPALIGWGAVVLLTSVGTYLTSRRRDANDRHPARLIRVTGFAAMTGGVIWALACAGMALVNGGMFGKNQSGNVLVPLLGLALTGIVAGLAGLMVLQTGRRSNLTRAALSISLAGGIGVAVLLALSATGLAESWFSSSARDWFWPLTFGGFMTFLLGLALSGLLLFFARPLPRWAGVLLLLAMASFITFNTEDARAWLGLPFGATWILLGWILTENRGSGVRSASQNP